MRRVLFLALALLLVAPAANAGGFFIGAAALQTGVEVDSESFDDDDNGFKVFGGYRLSDHFGVEVAYAENGSPEDVGVEFDVTSLSAFAVGTLTIGERFELFAKAGAYRWDVDLSGLVDGSDDDIEAAFGAGAKFKLGGKFALRLEYEVFEVESAIDADVDVLSVGGEWRF